ncbi:zinc finger protein [Culex quinquefasciatus]|uniref:Zinc finger protein n=1 Tax=Culex quinquefasciatus TaxID=7176 RepID=B0WUT5_CULQU|nr:zinc finger protein [Culex quinquefasciatus]|eukprot:XP_001859440.1 zinc finger protein [Culex quinquefasciatus]
MQHNNLVPDTTALCRVCMTPKEGNCTNLYDSCSLATSQPSLHEMLKIICVPVFGKSEAGDPPGMPTDVCSNCRHAVVAAFHLHQMCVETDRRLGELLALRWELEGPDGGDPLQGCDYIETNVADKRIKDALSSNQQLDMIKDEPLDLMDENEEDCDEPNPAENKEGEADKTNSEKLHHCEICNQSFTRMSAKVTHISFRHPDVGDPKGPFTCDLCGETFAFRGPMRLHRVSHLGEVVCTCGRSFSSKKTFNAHIDAGTCTGAQEKECKLCNATFRTLYSAVNHRRMVHPEQIKTLPELYCDICNKPFHGRRVLTQHKRTEHAKVTATTTQKKMYECSICRETFNTLSARGQRPYECSVCGFKFSILSQLKRHMLTHTKEKPHKCQLCPQAYAQTNDLVKHAARVHGIDKPYQCDRCDEGFRLLTDLRQHYRVHVQSTEGGADQMEEVRFTTMAILQRAFSKDKQQQAEGKLE